MDENLDELARLRRRYDEMFNVASQNADNGTGELAMSLIGGLGDGLTDVRNAQLNAAGIASGQKLAPLAKNNTLQRLAEISARVNNRNRLEALKRDEMASNWAKSVIDRRRAKDEKDLDLKTRGFNPDGSPIENWKKPGHDAEMEALRKLAYNAQIKSSEANAQEKANKSGERQVPGMDYVGEYTPTENDAKEVKKMKAAHEELQSSINRLANIVSQKGLRVMPGQDKTELESAYRDVQLKAKEAANLGAITGPDMEIIMGVVASPTDAATIAKLGDDPRKYIELLGGVKSQFTNSFNSRAGAYGYRIKGAPASAPASGGDKVRVISPDGRLGSIPAANLEKAIAQGYKRAP